MQREFEPSRIEIDGKLVRAVKINCGHTGPPRCNEVIRVRVTHGYGSPRDADGQVFKHAHRKFTAAGWHVGDRSLDDRCPECVARANQTVKNNEAAIVPTSAPHVEKPQAMTTSDWRVIHAKLMEVYGEEDKGYLTEWTDAKVAKDLGVPLAWIVEVREKCFGAASTNPHIEEVLKEAQTVRTQALEFTVRMTRLMTTCADVERIRADLAPVANGIAAKLEMVERKLFDVQKAMRP